MTAFAPHSDYRTDPAEPRLPLPTVPPLEARWAALMDAAHAVAEIAGEPDGADGALVGRLAEVRDDAAKVLLDDLTAVMRAGLAALLGARERGADLRPAASALLYEFAAAQDGLRATLARLP